MANDWLRLWHDMPNDPKWRTIARVSGQPITLVISVYVHLLVDASRNVTRGHADVTLEDIASALDVTESEVGAVIDAMNGRVIEDGYLTGWEKRQPKKEDAGSPESGVKSASERKREQRAREKLMAEKADVTQCHDVSRNVTLDTDTDTDTDNKKNKQKNPQPDGSGPLGDLEIQNQQNPATSSPPVGEVVYLPVAERSNKSPPEKPTRSKTTFATWLERVRLAGEKPISQDDPIFAYAERIGLTEDMLRAQWVEFKTRYMANQKKYADWRAVFANSVRGNWFKLWWHDGQQYRLTTVGVQAMRAIDAQGARASA